jgi:hypothetical protein
MATLTSSGVNFSDGTTINGTAFTSIGAVYAGHPASNVGTLTPGGTLAGSNLRSLQYMWDSCIGYYVSNPNYNSSLSGTWTNKGAVINANGGFAVIAIVWVRTA